jgi:hypothetical protein
LGRFGSRLLQRKWMCTQAAHASSTAVAWSTPAAVCGVVSARLSRPWALVWLGAAAVLECTVWSCIWSSGTHRRLLSTGFVLIASGLDCLRQFGQTHPAKTSTDAVSGSAGCERCVLRHILGADQSPFVPQAWARLLQGGVVTAGLALASGRHSQHADEPCNALGRWNVVMCAAWQTRVHGWGRVLLALGLLMPSCMPCSVQPRILYSYSCHVQQVLQAGSPCIVASHVLLLAQAGF